MAKKTNVEISGQKYYKVTRTVGHKADGTPIKNNFMALVLMRLMKKLMNILIN